MNPTDEVDDLLTRAGARWRADQPSAPEPDLDRILGGRRLRRGGWVPAVAAASVAVIAIAALTVLPGGDKPPAAGPTGGTTQSVAEGKQTANDDLLVRDGDKVRVAGQVIATPGQEPVFCPPLPNPGIDPGWGRRQESAPTCPAQYAVTLKGLDLTRLSQLRTIQGVRTGYTDLTGIWTGRTIEVQDQAEPRPRTTTLEQIIPPDEVPCPEPSGGWSTTSNEIDKAAVSAFVDARADQITQPRLLYPKGRTPGTPEVYTIGVAHGDPAAIRRAFEKVYGGNLCVYRVKLSQADHARIATAVGNLIPKGLGVYLSAATSDNDKVGVSALVYDEALKTALTPLGLDNLDLDVAVKPVR